MAADPDALVELADDLEALHTGDAEALGMLVWEMWEELTGDCGGELPPDGTPSQGPIGDRIDLRDQEAVRQRFPRLAEFVGSAGAPR